MNRASAPQSSDSPSVRRDWTRDQIATLFNKPLLDLLFQAQKVHRIYFDARSVQLSALLSIKTGGCPEDCGYCAQSAHFKTGVTAGKLMPIDVVLEEAGRAKWAGATRFCMAAAWRGPKDRDLAVVCEMVEKVRALAGCGKKDFPQPAPSL